MKCRSCGADIVFLKTSSGKFIPVNADMTKSEDAIFRPEIHTAHFATCPQAKQWRKKHA